MGRINKDNLTQMMAKDEDNKRDKRGKLSSPSSPISLSSSSYRKICKREVLDWVWLIFSQIGSKLANSIFASFSPKYSTKGTEISIVRVFSLPLVVDLRKVIVLFLMSVTWRDRASLIRQPVNKQMAKRQRAREVTNPSLNNRFNSLAVKTFPCPFTLTFIEALYRSGGLFDESQISGNSAQTAWELVAKI